MLARLVVAACACTFGANEPQRFGALHLTVDLGQGAAALSEVRLGRGASGADLQEWTAKLDTVPLRLALRSWSRAEFETLLAPPDVVEVVEWNLANDDREAKRPSTFTFDSTRAVTGPFGCVDYAWLGIATRFDGTRATATLLDFAGITPEFGWDLWIESSTPLTAPQVERLVSALRGAVRYDGPRLDPEWSDAEVLARWTKNAPKRVLERRKLEVVRTSHYVIMTVVGKGTAKEFGKKLESCYERIRSIFPFDDVEGQRLLPVYYFMEEEEYFQFCVDRLGWDRAEAEASGGVAYEDWYATYHQAANAPVHIHEATHQIFRNRIMLSGGGSWFQEGVAEYMSSQENELNVIQRLVKDGAHTPLARFLVIPTLLGSSSGSRVTGEDEAGVAYAQAASIVEYVRHSEETRARFLQWVHAVGRLDSGDLPALEATMQRVLGFGIEGLEARWKAYVLARKKVRDWQWPAAKMNAAKR